MQDHNHDDLRAHLEKQFSSRGISTRQILIPNNGIDEAYRIGTEFSWSGGIHPEMAPRPMFTWMIWPKQYCIYCKIFDGEPIVNVGWWSRRDDTRTCGNGVVGDWLHQSGGIPRKLPDGSRLHGLGWRPRISLKEGIAATYTWFKEHAVDAQLWLDRAVNRIGHCAFSLKARTKYA
jgi:hypothetical protein